jgi:hypothetical protein
MVVQKAANADAGSPCQHLSFSPFNIRDGE